jgi:hypothetical protein
MVKKPQDVRASQDVRVRKDERASQDVRSSQDVRVSQSRIKEQDDAKRINVKAKKEAKRIKEEQEEAKRIKEEERIFNEGKIRTIAINNSIKRALINDEAYVEVNYDECSHIPPTVSANRLKRILRI